MGKTINRISGLDSGKYIVEEAKDEQRQGKREGKSYSPDQEKDQFDKKSDEPAWKKLLPDSRQSSRPSAFRNKAEVSWNRIAVPETSQKNMLPNRLMPQLVALGILNTKGKVRVPAVIAYGLLTLFISTISIILLRIFLWG